jgi:glycosyltransferase involved in cell wall biosynthesis
MKIALVVGWEYDTPPPKYGGVELVVGDLADELVRRGHDVYLLAPGTSRTSATLVPYIPRSVDRSPDIKHEYHLWAGQYKLHCLANIRRLLAELRPDVIHSHVGALLLPFAPDFRCPIVTTEHWELTEPIDVAIRRRYPTYRAVAISQRQQAPFPGPHWLDVVYHGLDLRRYAFQVEKGDYFAFLGRISPVKGLDLVCRVIKNSPYRLKIGAKVDPHDRVYLEQAVQPLIDSEQIEWLGEVDQKEKVDLLRSAKAVLSWLNYEEAFGLIYPEANACGTPAIVNPMGATPELIGNGVNGFLVTSEEEFRAKLDQVETIDPYACRRVVEERFSLPVMAARYEQVYERVIDEMARGV